MNIPDRPLDCYVGCFKRPLQEPYLRANGFSRGMMIFAIPAQGVLFKCRADGSRLDMEFGSFFALLRFINTSLAKLKVTEVKVHSSNPEFVFSLANNGSQIRDNSRRVKMLAKYRKLFSFDVVYTPPHRNRIHLTPDEFPSTPAGQIPPVRPRKEGSRQARFVPIQKGLSL